MLRRNATINRDGRWVRRWSKDGLSPNAWESIKMKGIGLILKLLLATLSASHRDARTTAVERITCAPRMRSNQAAVASGSVIDFVHTGALRHDRGCNRKCSRPETMSLTPTPLRTSYMRRSLGGTWFVATAIIGLPGLLNAHEVSRGATW